MATPIISNLQTVPGMDESSKSFTVTLANTADRDNVQDIAAWTCATGDLPADPHEVPESASLLTKTQEDYTWVCAIMTGCSAGRTLRVVTVERWIGGHADVTFPEAGQG